MRRRPLRRRYGRGPLLGRALLLAAALASGACHEGPAPGPGTLTVSVVSPRGAEGAAVLALHGPGIDGVDGSGAWVRTRPGRGDTLVVAVVAEEAGPLSFRVALADTLRRPAVRILQVAGPDDALREALEGYRVEVTP